jgi:hypothetical protein
MSAGLIDSLAESRRLHGIPVSVYRDSSKYDPEAIWAGLGAALDLIAAYKPVWIARLEELGVRIHVQTTPGTRAKLVGGDLAVLDSYFVSSFLPAQIASSVVHEATHARVRARGIEYSTSTIAREERMCRRSELRLGYALLAAGEQGAEAVIQRAAAALSLADEQVAPAVDWRELAVLAEVNRIAELPVPKWLKRRIARRAGVLETAAGRDAFGGDD